MQIYGAATISQNAQNIIYPLQKNNCNANNLHDDVIINFLALLLNFLVTEKFHHSKFHQKVTRIEISVIWYILYT